MFIFEFKPWAKTSRLESPCVMSEKLNGANGAFMAAKTEPTEEYPFEWAVGAQSRTRLAEINSDQTGIAQWVLRNYESLIHDLGEGYHYGEFVKGNGLKEPHFFLFNTGRWQHVDFQTPTLRVVPILYEGEYSQQALDDCILDLETNGSKVLATPPEGVVVYWKHDGSIKKHFCKNGKK